ncbi:hypothetical protein SPI_07374 [Niveomyces insectorum RCEF 264]|uniref:Csi2 protein n=1 Tax=Niveomyces insectorum RCEF 264 TaxID=1081102 RepID=A0A167PT23_9HYPO|nr:hypothetical protein SPI_07374 [Niveomyces insectorum RCEF 264]
MARSRWSLKRSLLISTFVAVSLFSAAALAADPPKTTNGNTGNTNKPAPTPTQKQTNTPKNDPTSAPPPTSDKQPAPTSDPKASAPKSDPPKSADPPTSDAPKSDPDGGGSSTQKQTVIITPTGGAPTTGDTGSLPTVATSASVPKLSLPTLTLPNTGIPTYPAPSVPPTQNAPFMQHSKLPDGTVFIAVGSILGAFGAAVLIWRAVVAYLLHRSIARAALAQHAANDKAPFAAPPAPFYKYADRESSLNLGVGGGAAGLGGAGSSVAGSTSARGVRRTNRGPTPSATPSQTNLFFSPTAPGASGLGGAGNRDSRHLPSGFYAAGSASPAGPGHGQAINLANLRPDSRGHGRTVGPSPPDSPSFGPMRSTPLPRNMSGSSVSLNRPASGRAPSAFLDDLLDDQPHMFPPGGPSHHHTYSQSSHGGSRY